MENEIKNAIIKRADLSYGDHGCLTCWLHLDYGGSGQGFGGHALYLPKSWAHHEVKSFAGHFIFRILEIAGVYSWDQLAGKTIRVKGTRNKIDAVGHIVNEDWFCPSEDFEP